MGRPGAARPTCVGHPGKAEAGSGDGEGGGRCRLPLGRSAGALSWGLSAWAVVLALARRAVRVGQAASLPATPSLHP